ncbi:uncharacterized protein [Bemisia tabaci]|uniref:uncharacterized protein isoform X3 n=1 Tax=Bemisia tabaci TaxID=7038 RepID=UPI003B2814D2
MSSGKVEVGSACLILLMSWHMVQVGTNVRIGHRPPLPSSLEPNSGFCLLVPKKFCRRPLPSPPPRDIRRQTDLIPRDLFDVTKDNYGLDRIEVTDNGSGISHQNAPLVCLPSHTSKINSLHDLERLASYGFRGEALSAICAVAQVTIVTRSKDHELAMAYTYDSNGKVSESRMAHRGKGTVICATGLFKSLPVRKQIMSKNKKAQEELRNVEQAVKSFAVIHPNLRVTLAHNKCLIWQKTSVANLKLAFLQVASSAVVKNLDFLDYKNEELSLAMLVPRFDSDFSIMGLSSPNKAFFFYINLRPIKDSKLEKEKILRIVKDQLLKYYNNPLAESNVEITKNFFLRKEILDCDGFKTKKRRIESDVNSHDSESGRNTNGQNCVENYCEAQNIEVLKKPNNDTSQNYPKTCEKQKIFSGVSADNFLSLYPSEPNCETQNGGQVGMDQKSLKNDIVNGLFSLSGDVNASAQNRLKNVSAETGEMTVENVPLNTDSTHQGTACNVSEISDVRKTNLDTNICANAVAESVGVLHTSLSEHPKNEETMKLKLGDVKMNGDYSTGIENSTISYTNAFISGSDDNIFSNELLTSLENSDECSKIRKFSSNLSSSSTSSDESNGRCGTTSNSDNICKFLDGILDLEVPNVSQTEDQIFKNEKCSSSSCDKEWSECTSTQNSASQSTHNQSSVCSSIFEEEKDLKFQNFLKSHDEKVKEVVPNSVQNKESSNNVEEISALLTAENCQVTGLNINEITASQWSMGQVALDSNLLQGPGVFTKETMNNVSTLQPVHTPRKETSGKTLVKKKGGHFMDVAKELSLLKPEVEKDVFGMKVEKTSEVSQKQELTQKSKSKEDMRSWLKHNRRLLCCETKHLKFIGEMIKSQEILSSDNSVILFRKVTHVNDSSTAWLYQENSKIGLVNVHRLREVTEYHRLLVDKILPSKALEKTIEFSESDVGSELWKTLLSLRSRTCLDEDFVAREIIDQRMTHNGLKISLKDVDGRHTARIIGVPQNVSYFGLTEVKETLHLISRSFHMNKCRPMKIKCLLKGEVTRICEAVQTEEITEEQIFNWLVHWINYIRPTDDKCLHQIPVLYPLHDLDAVY